MKRTPRPRSARLDAWTGVCARLFASRDDDRRDADRDDSNRHDADRDDSNRHDADRDDSNRHGGD